MFMTIWKPGLSCTKHVGFIELHEVRENHTSCNLILVDLLQVVETTCIKLADKSFDNQLASSLLTTACYSQAGQATRTYPDIGLMTGNSSVGDTPSLTYSALNTNHPS